MRKTVSDYRVPVLSEKRIPPSELSREFRHSTSPLLVRRRGIIGLSLLAIGALGVVTLYQSGITRHVPEPPVPLLDGDRLHAAGGAYATLSMPDGALGIASYAATLGLAAMGGEDRALRQPWIPLAMAAKVAFDAVPATVLAVTQWTRYRASCFWCLLTSAATLAMLPLAYREARIAIGRLKGEPPRRILLTGRQQ